MPKAAFKLPNGTQVEIEGTTEEVQRLLGFYIDQPINESGPKKQSKIEPRSARKPKHPKDGVPTNDDLATIVNKIKTCDETQAIESQILDRTSEVNRVLLPLYIVNQYMADAFGLTTVEISTITTDLGIKVFRQNALRALTSSGSRYVIGDRVRKTGQATRYKLNPRGVQYIKDILRGQSDGEQN
jgi:hypothetical protein